MPQGMTVNGKAPTSPIGSPDVLWGLPGQGGLLTEWAETVPDLTWPDSVLTYGRMRRDARITAVLSSFVLPIMRTNWAVDPEGIDRSAAVDLVSQDLGLPVLGEKGQPDESSIPGFKWHEHVRLALLNLVYGHMPFEKWYEDRGGLTHLAGVQERQPHTISMIDINDDGTVNSISQNTQNEPIPANRLLWYSHEREGANWAGVSLLRSCYTPWILKHETLRVHATSIRRFGMGVPNVEAPPGSTPGQIAQAQQLASGMRVGDTAGAGLPNGFKLNITGMTGSAPDSLGFLNYLDQQITTSALAQIIELGHAGYGSRALGESFLDLFLLSLQAIADNIGDTATIGDPGMPGLAKSLVEYNWGEGEPVPRIVATDVGDRHEITATAVSEMITSGALSPDPNLEAFLREAWGLPERDPAYSAPAPEMPWAPKGQEAPPAGSPATPGPTPGATPAVPDNVAPSPAPQARRRHTPARAAAPAPARKPEPRPFAATAEAPPAPKRSWLPPMPARAARRARWAPWRTNTSEASRAKKAQGPGGLRRPLTEVEAKAGMEPLVIRDESAKAVTALASQWDPVAAAMQKDLAEQVAAAVDAGNLPGVAQVQAQTAPAAKLLATAMTDMAWTGATRMIAEAARQGVTINPATVTIDDTRIAQIAQARAAMIGARLASEASRKALGGIKASAGTDAADSVRVHLKGLSDKPLADQMVAAMSAAQNMGRIAAGRAGLDDGNTASFTASEILDDNTCDPCLDIDGTDFGSLDDAEAAYPNGGYTDCDGMERCRGTVIANWGEGDSAQSGDLSDAEANVDDAGDLEDAAGDLADEAADAEIDPADLPWVVKGDTGVIKDSMGIDRGAMPQLSGMINGVYHPPEELTPQFLKQLLSHGITVKPERAVASTLKSTQTSVDMRVVRSIAGDLRSGKLADTKQIMVSSDDRILDGHHTWAGRLEADLEGGRPGLNPGMAVLRVDQPMDVLLDEARAFDEEKGIPFQKAGEFRELPKAAAPQPVDTVAMYTNADGTYTAGREALHQQIIDGILEGHTPKDNPVATFFGGGPASGKSVLTAVDDSAHVDADQIMAKFPEYQQMLAAGDPRAAMFNHEEASFISKEAVQAAQEKRLNFVLDGTGDSSYAKFAGKIAQARDAGYRIDARYVTADADTAVARAAERAKETGRMVPETVIRSIHASVSQVYEQAIKNHLFDDTDLYDSNEFPPTLIAHMDQGEKFVIDNQAAYAKFIAKGHLDDITGPAPEKALDPAVQSVVTSITNLADQAGAGDEAVDKALSTLGKLLDKTLGYPSRDPDFLTLADVINESGTTVSEEYQPDATNPQTGAPESGTSEMFATLSQQYLTGATYDLGAKMTEDSPLPDMITNYFESMGLGLGGFR
jgi:predicted ABC-type ATPase